MREMLKQFRRTQNDDMVMHSPMAMIMNNERAKATHQKVVYELSFTSKRLFCLSQVKSEMKDMRARLNSWRAKTKARQEWIQGDMGTVQSLMWM